MIPVINRWFSSGLATLWISTLVFPLLGFFVTVGDPIKEDVLMDNKTITVTIQRQLFEYLPHTIANHANVFCEMYYPLIAMKHYKERIVYAPFDPDAAQKVLQIICSITMYIMRMLFD